MGVCRGNGSADCHDPTVGLDWSNYLVFPQHYVRGIAVALFICFGLKLLYDASRISGKKLDGEQADALGAVKQREKAIAIWSARTGFGILAAMESA